MTFAEKQRFTHWWLWAILLSLAVVATLGLYQQLYRGEPFGDNPMSDTGLIVFAVSMYTFPVLFGILRLDTTIDSESISFHFVPFLKKSFKWTNVESAKVLEYGTEGGWGIKHSSKYGTVYSTGGDYGMAVKMKDGRKFVIGTQKEEELKGFLEKSAHLVQS
ncbi:hypothetical protein O3Q51_06345 [Cryomorphaceae bacterium 1068]|nr:hypothetical protein [Cryomorphaceae bacterium 1068]